MGAVTTNLALLDAQTHVLRTVTVPTAGRPAQAVESGLRELDPPASGPVAGTGATGSGRTLAGRLVQADVVKNEITAHYLAAIQVVPEVATIIEIGGQDSKIILIRDGIIADFAMNTVCAAGTGSFLDQQASRLGVPIERFGELARRSQSPADIAGRCTVFAESDMVHKQQQGETLEDIVAGLCDAIVRNYLHNVARGKELRAPVMFQGGVAANVGVRDAFERALGLELIVPEHHQAMGAIGAALLAREAGAGR